MLLCIFTPRINLPFQLKKKVLLWEKKDKILLVVFVSAFIWLCSHLLEVHFV